MVFFVIKLSLADEIRLRPVAGASSQCPEKMVGLWDFNQPARDHRENPSPLHTAMRGIWPMPPPIFLCKRA
jgi:hypothetical protein